MMEFYDRTTPRGKKKYECFLCDAPIEKGEKHVYEKGKWEGEFFVRRSHAACSEMVNFHLNETGDCDFTEYEVLDTIWENICPECPEKEDCGRYPLRVFRCPTVMAKLEEVLGDE